MFTSICAAEYFVLQVLTSTLMLEEHAESACLSVRSREGFQASDANHPEYAWTLAVRAASYSRAPSPRLRILSTRCPISWTNPSRCVVYWSLVRHAAVTQLLISHLISLSYGLERFRLYLRPSWSLQRLPIQGLVERLQWSGTPRQLLQRRGYAWRNYRSGIIREEYVSR